MLIYRIYAATVVHDYFERECKVRSIVYGAFDKMRWRFVWHLLIVWEKNKLFCRIKFPPKRHTHQHCGWFVHRMNWCDCLKFTIRSFFFCLVSVFFFGIKDHECRVLFWGISKFLFLFVFHFVVVVVVLNIVINDYTENEITM